MEREKNHQLQHEVIIIILILSFLSPLFPSSPPFFLPLSPPPFLVALQPFFLFSFLFFPVLSPFISFTTDIQKIQFLHFFSIKRYPFSHLFSLNTFSSHPFFHTAFLPVSDSVNESSVSESQFSSYIILLLLDSRIFFLCWTLSHSLFHSLTLSLFPSTTSFNTVVKSDLSMTFK